MSRWVSTGSCFGFGLVLLASVAVDASWGRWWRAPLPIDLHIVLLCVAFAPYVAIVERIVRGVGTVHGPEGERLLRGLLVLAVLLRVVTLLGPHRYNSDVYRYLWDGHVLASGFNPYAHVPEDAALDAIRDARFYEGMNPAYNRIHTVYGPVATVCFAVCSRVPWDPVWMIRLLMTAGDVLTLILLIRVLRCCNLPRTWALIYGLNPLLLDSFAQRGQVEGLMLPLFALALLWVARRRHGRAGAVLAAAVLVKGAALIVLPLFIRAAWGGDRRSAARLMCGFLMVLAVGGQPVWIAAPESFEGLSTYCAQWRTNDSLFALADAIGGPTFARVFGLLGLSAVLAGCVLTKYEVRSTKYELRSATCPIPEHAARMGVALGGALLFAPAVFPWYVTWCLPFVPFLLVSKRWQWAGVGILCWSAGVQLWYLRFLVYPPMDAVHWPGLADALRAAGHWMREPWRVVEYALVAVAGVVTGVACSEKLRGWQGRGRGRLWAWVTGRS